MSDKDNKRKNARNWYIQLQQSFFNDPDYRRFRRRLPPQVRDGTVIYLKMLLLAITDTDTNKAEDVTLVFLHEEETFAEEIAYMIQEDPADVEAVLNTLCSIGMIEEIGQDVFMIHFPNGTIGSITDSSLRSRKSRAKRQALQSNTGATQGQHESNQYNSNNNIHNKKENNIDSDSYININSSCFDMNNNISGSEAAGGNASTPPSGALAPAAPLPLFTLEEVRAQAARRKKSPLTDPEIEAMYRQFCADGFAQAMKYKDNGESKTQALFHAVNTWAASRTTKAEGEQELDDLKILTNSELLKMFPDCEDYDDSGKRVFWSEGFKGIAGEAPNHPNDREEISDWFDENGDKSINKACRQVWGYFDRILETAYKYINENVMWNYSYSEPDQLTLILRAAGKIPENSFEYYDYFSIPELLPLFCPYKAFTTEQRRFLFTAYGVRFPVGNVKLLNGQEVKTNA